MKHAADIAQHDLSRARRQRTVLALALVLAAAAVLPLAHGAAAATGRQARVDTGIVDVNTNLGLQNAAAAGTGIVLGSSGIVLTNNHVIRGATTIKVVDPSTGHTYTATVLGYDVSHDVAVLQLKGAHLQAATLGSSATVRVGDSVTAVGNAGGVGGTPSSTTGSVTALNKSITVSDEQGDTARLAGLIETDAALQPGDSGGPLLDSTGRVIGMDTAASSGYDFRQGSGDGYAIPIDKALSIEKQIVARHASATVHLGATPFLGLQAQSPSDARASGVLVLGVFPGSPAEGAGIASGDVLTALDDRALASSKTLTALLLGKSPGASVKVSWVDQYGKRNSASVRLAAGPPQ